MTGSDLDFWLSFSAYNDHFSEKLDGWIWKIKYAYVANNC